MGADGLESVRADHRGDRSRRLATRRRLEARDERLPAGRGRRRDRLRRRHRGDDRGRPRGGRAARADQAARARPRPRRPPRDRSRPRRSGRLPSRRARRRRGRRRIPLLQARPNPLSLPAHRLSVPAQALGRRAGEGRRYGQRKRGDRRVRRQALPRPCAGADRALARERPRGAGQRHHLLRRLAEVQAGRLGRTSRTASSTRITTRRSRASASSRHSSRASSPPGIRSR